MMSNLSTSCEPLEAQRCAKFSNGNTAKIRAHIETLVRTTLRGPKRETRGVKTPYWTIPPMHPYHDIHKPIDAGLMPSPPNSTDVDQTNGMSATDALRRRASIA